MLNIITATESYIYELNQFINYDCIWITFIGLCKNRKHNFIVSLCSTVCHLCVSSVFCACIWSACVRLKHKRCCNCNTFNASIPVPVRVYMIHSFVWPFYKTTNVQISELLADVSMQCISDIVNRSKMFVCILMLNDLWWKKNYYDNAVKMSNKGANNVCGCGGEWENECVCVWMRVPCLL